MSSCCGNGGNYTCSKLSQGTLFLPFLNECEWNNNVRIVLYLIAMLWCFMGVAIIADVFMCAIEIITSKTKKIKVGSATAESGYHEVEVRIWNDTVANLTLMALGSSAPEILLSIIEIIGNKFEAGQLGPSTIVGSAAFNLLCITAVCVAAIPDNQVRTVKAVKVFAVTASFSIVAYIWLYIILQVSTPDVIDVWEAVITFLLFPILVIIAYIADKEYGCGGKIEPDDPGMLELAEGAKQLTQGHLDPEVQGFIKEVSRNPNISEDDAAKLVAMHIKAKQPKGYGYYRLAAIRDLNGGRKLKPKLDPKLKMMYEELSEVGFSTSEASHILAQAKPQVAVVEFAAPQYSVLESDKLVKVGVSRSGNTKVPCTVNYETIDGTAMSGEDYHGRKDTLLFKAGEVLKYIDITIIDDNEWEPDETFFIKLSPFDPSDEKMRLGKQTITEVTIINDDEPGIVAFSKPSFIVKESVGTARLLLQRTDGCDGRVSVTWTSIDQSAMSGKDFVGGTGEIVFEHGEQSKNLELEIIDDKAFEKDESFMVEISKPSGGATIGRIKRTIVTIVNDDEYKKLFDRVVALTHLNLDRLDFASSSWGAQFRAALSVNGGDTENAGTLDYVMHFFTFLWKVIFSFVPPCTWLNGWLSFFVALGMIGILTAIISDLATTFGCLCDLKPEVTAITFVALGTSLPDLFASKTAAVNEKHADASIGNVTGSNSVNVFLGLGTPWVIASIYHLVNETPGGFKVPAGTLAVSVIAFTCCAILCLCWFVLRRKVKFFGSAELGGPVVPKYLSALFFVLLWMVYLVVSSLVAYDVISF